MAIAGVYDALTAERCYKKAMPIAKAYSIVKESVGTQFDLLLYEMFLTPLKKRYSNESYKE